MKIEPDDEEDDVAENGVTRSEYEDGDGRSGASWEEYKSNVEASGNWDEDDCPEENYPDCDR